MHICDDDIPAAISSAQVMHEVDHAHDHENAVAKTSNAADKAHVADACCFSGHGCHSLHSLMVSDSSHACLTGSAHAMNGPDSQLTGGAFSARHERPKWPAA